MSWTGRSLVGLLLLAAFLAPAAPAEAVGPFSHFTFCRALWPSLSTRLGLDPSQAKRLWPGFLAGAIAHDAGYYPGGESNLAYAVHLLRPWQLTRAMLALARNSGEQAFALGWLSHALLDLRAHRDLVNAFTQGPYSEHMLAHKQFEWGLDCWLLARPQGAWLWEAPLDWRAGLGLWQRAVATVYGRLVPRSVLEQAMLAHQKQVRQLPYVFWLSGRLERPGRWAGNALGWVLGHSARPLYVAWLTWRDQDLDARGVLTARWPLPQDQRGLLTAMAQSAQELNQVLAGGAWPQGTLDADPGCEEQGCDQAKQARKWLDSLPAIR
ncbi:zinc dependent phospholipase C family protein [Desulfoferula mesophila]|uniref:Phospholipase C/D domain-containing protein n=1 Tax=Desulfoferula mesophila TaxID=3058419 RepID=A0AAU9EF40_9BACT|nr:hypothetical protein FAK_24560 [Desulfoferula mesophilus]